MNELQKALNTLEIGFLEGKVSKEVILKARAQVDELSKGKSMPIGTIHNGFKKIAEGKWRKVSEHGMTKEEHKKESERHKPYTLGKVNNQKMMDEQNEHFKEMGVHDEASSKLDTKEYSDVEVHGGKDKGDFKEGNEYTHTNSKGVQNTLRFKGMMGNNYHFEVKEKDGTWQNQVLSPEMMKEEQGKFKEKLNKNGLSASFVNKPDKEFLAERGYGNVNKSISPDLQKAILTLELGHLLNQVSADTLEKARGHVTPLGTVVRRADGKDWKKTSNGWEPVKKGKGGKIEEKEGKQESYKDLPIGSVLTAQNKGLVQIISGDEARSADVYPGDKFIITSKENPHFYFGKLITQGVFKRDAGLSGKDQLELDKLPIVDKIVYGMNRSKANGGEDDFWATFKSDKKDAAKKATDGIDPTAGITNKQGATNIKDISTHNADGSKEGDFESQVKKLPNFDKVDKNTARRFLTLAKEKNIDPSGITVRVNENKSLSILVNNKDLGGRSFHSSWYDQQTNPQDKGTGKESGVKTALDQSDMNEGTKDKMFGSEQKKGDKIEHNGVTIHVGKDTSGGQNTTTYTAPSVSDKTFWDLGKLKEVIDGKDKEGKFPTKEDIISKLVSDGNNSDDAKKMVEEHYDYIKRVYPSSGLKKLAEVISTIY